MNIIVTFILLSWLTNLGTSVSQNGKRYVEDACSVTHYRDLCIRSLASFSNTAKRNPCMWARAGVSVTISEAKRVAQYLIRVKKQRHMRGKNRVALSDCIECIQDSLDNLHRSLDVLRKLSGRTFDAQMSDVTTWMSTSLTDEETCLDGFEGQRGNQVRMLRSQVQNVTYITSNALALAAKLASTGAGGINGA
ncbi:Pectinesterase inhibitor domain [Dillenia turbinata]|uniref:Pectinesterase inhibitor domain n=1 Tax=Dillenia turbinata TaxID=194707 RepID=A0AAN8W6S6_9MAGN